MSSPSLVLKSSGFITLSRGIGAAVLLFLAACSGAPTPVLEDGGERPPDAGTDAGDDGGVDAGTDGGWVPGDGGAAIAIGFGGAKLDELLDVVVDAVSVYVAGYQDGVPGTLDPSGDSAGIVRRYSRATGELVWETRYDLEKTIEVADALWLDGDSLLVAGRTSGSLGGSTSAGQTDLFVSRLHLEGGTATPLLQIGDERPQHPARIAVDARGEIVIAGLNDTWVDGNHVAAWEDTLLARVTFDAAQNVFTPGSIVRSDTPAPDMFFGLAPIGGAGDVIVSGLAQAGSARGPFVRRLDADAGVVWSRRLSQLPFEAAMAVAVGPDGLVYVAGSTFGQVGDRAYGELDAFVAVLDPATGEVLRGMQAGTEAPEWVRDLAVEADGTVRVAGGTAGALPGFALAGAQDAFVVVFDAQGRWVSSWQHGSAGFDEVNALAVDESGNAYVAGQTEGEFIPGHPFGGGRDGFLLRVPPSAFLPVPGAGR